MSACDPRRRLSVARARPGERFAAVQAGDSGTRQRPKRRTKPMIPPAARMRRHIAGFKEVTEDLSNEDAHVCRDLCEEPKDPAVCGRSDFRDINWNDDDARTGANAK